MTRDVSNEGKKMQSALSKPISKGFSNMKKSIGGMLNSMKGALRQVLTLGGGIGGAALVKSAVDLHGKYRDIEFSLSKLPEEAMSLAEIQKVIESSAEKAGQRTGEMAESFHSIFEATGDASYAAASVKAIGVAATASGESIDTLSEASQLMSRKFGISEKDLNEGLASFIALTGTGGKSIDELTGRFAVMAGEASAAGMKGVGGLQQLLGLLINLDSTIGEKADPGLKMMFQTIKSGSAQLKRLQKEARIKFDPDMTGLEKIRQLLTTKKGRAAAELVFTSDARQVFDTLAKPFDDAMGEAKEKGLSKAEALDAALSAFDANLKKASKVSMEFSDIQKKAADRMANDPSAKMRQALNKVEQAFTRPKMINAIEKLADKLPALADAVADLIEWITENPWQAAVAGVGLRAGGSFLTGAAGAGMSALLGKAAGGGAAAAGAAGAGAGAAGAGAAGAGAGGIMAAGIAGIAQAGLAGAAVGAGIGVGMNAFVFDPQNQKYADMLHEAQGVTASGKYSMADKTAAIANIQQLRAEMAKNYNGTETFFGSIASRITGSRSPFQDYEDAMANLANVQTQLAKDLNTQLQSLKGADMDEFARSMKDAGRNARTLFVNETSRGPKRLGTEPVVKNGGR